VPTTLNVRGEYRIPAHRAADFLAAQAKLLRQYDAETVEQAQTYTNEDFDALGLGQQTQDRLMAAGVNSLELLLDKTATQVWELADIGLARLHEINSAVLKAGKCLKDGRTRQFKGSIEDLLRAGHEVGSAYRSCKKADVQTVAELIQLDGVELRRLLGRHSEKVVYLLSKRSLAPADLKPGWKLTDVLNKAPAGTLARADIYTLPQLLTYTEATLADKVRGKARYPENFAAGVQLQLAQIHCSLRKEREEGEA